MFTGLIEDIGTVTELQNKGDIISVSVASQIPGGEVKLGDSIAIDGCCLTVTQILEGGFTFDIGPESLRVTSLKRLRAGSTVHLERAMALGDRLGGHMVLGHVDDVGVIVQRTQHAETLELRVRCPPGILRYCIAKGSITIDGVSLTINHLHEDALDVWLIPHTLEKTRLLEIKEGDEVNLEADLIGKYVERLLAPQKAGLSLEALKAAGF